MLERLVAAKNRAVIFMETRAVRSSTRRLISVLFERLDGLTSHMQRKNAPMDVWRSLCLYHLARTKPEARTRKSLPLWPFPTEGKGWDGGSKQLVQQENPVSTPLGGVGNYACLASPTFTPFDASCIYTAWRGQ